MIIKNTIGDQLYGEYKEEHIKSIIIAAIYCPPKNIIKRDKSEIF